MGRVIADSAGGERHVCGAGQIVWLASYPKSGNTWLRSLLTAYQRGMAKELDINALNSTGASSRPTLDDLLGLATSDLDANELRDLLPCAYRSWSAMEGGPHWLKTHDAWAVTSKGEDVFPAEATRCVVHLVRDPRDVVVSAQHHWGLTLDKTIACLNNPEYWVGNGHDFPNVPQRLSDWSRHTVSWLDCPLPRITVRYEDLLAQPAESFRRVLKFVATEVDEARLEHAVAACALERLQAQENTRGFQERLSVSTAPFFRSGRAGGWREVLNGKQCARIVDAHGEVMQRLGYSL